MARWTEGYWWSKDGLRLHYRDYAAVSAETVRPPILCIPGLTRNARDWEPVAERLAGEWRVIAVDLRGRGESAYAKDPMSYTPLVYLQDLDALIAELKLARLILFGTSLGGLLTALLASTGRERIAAALINDVGPVIDPVGLGRIRSYVGRSASWPTWLHAARALAESQGVAHPQFALEDWLAMAKRLCRLTAPGRIVFDYDMRIAEPFRLPGGEAGIDLWPAFEALRDVPTLLVRGALSDILSEQSAAEMIRRIPSIECVTVDGIGHAPVLDEPASIKGIDRLLARVGPPRASEEVFTPNR